MEHEPAGQELAGVPSLGTASRPVGKVEAASSDEGAGTPPASRRWRRGLFSAPRSVSDRLTIYVVRALFFLVAAGLGLHGARAFSSVIAPQEYSPFAGMVIGCVAAVVLIVVEALFARSPVRTIAAITFGLLLGLLLGLVLQPVVEVITQTVVPDLNQDGMTVVLAFVKLMTTSIFCYFGVALLLATKDDFKFVIPFVEFRKEVKSQVPLLLDTSVFIDGRIQGLLEAGVLDQRLEMPRFVMDELQRIADSPDRAMRERGRRGMDIMQEIQRYHWVDVVESPLDVGEDVDAGLLRLAAAHEGKILTTDFNLTKRARLQTVPVLNINDLANAMKPVFVPGESLNVRLLRPGDEAGQGVGFLADGTMVVVENTREKIGQEVSVEVTSSLQTSAGKMVFARLRNSGREKAR